MVDDVRFTDIGAQVKCLNPECGYGDHVDFTATINEVRRIFGLFASVTQDKDGFYMIDNDKISRYGSGMDGVICGGDVLNKVKSQFVDKKERLQKWCDEKNERRSGGKVAV